MEKLVKLCQEQLGWKRTTTYTVIKRLSQRGVLKNENAVVQIHDDYIEDIDENAARVKEILTKARKRRKAAAKPAAAQQKSYAPQL